MADERKPSRSLSEIGHLFLSSVRDRQTNGAPLPKRQPPGANAAQSKPATPRTDVSIDLTPEEVAQVYGPIPAVHSEESGLQAAVEASPAVSAIIGAHLNGRQIECAREYARHLAAAGQRVGLMEIDAGAFRISCFDASSQDDAAGDVPHEALDAREMAEAIEELNWDLDRWLLMLPNPRSCEARCLLRDVGHWVLLSTCDHDGVVSSYRTLKGLRETNRPRLSLALLGARDGDEAENIHRKLASVCQQFLDWPLEAEAAVGSAPYVNERAAVSLRLQRSGAAIGPQWQVVADFLARAKGNSAYAGQQRPALDAIPTNVPAEPTPAASITEKLILETTGESMVAPVAASTVHIPESTGPRHVADVVVPRPAPQVHAAAAPAAPPSWANTEAAPADDEVIDLADAQPTAGAILSAVLRSQAGELIECPVPAPACPESRLAVTRDRRLVLLAVAEQGLGELRAIGRAYQWLTENRALIAMALPQLSIDAAALPRLRLLIDHADLTAETLQPLLQSGTVSVVAYRKLRWGGKTGLLLEAA